VRFAFTEEQDALRAGMRRFLRDKSPEPEVRRLMASDDGYDPAVWETAGRPARIAVLDHPEQFGGSGYSYVRVMIVLEEIGNALLCAPYYSTIALATNALLTSGDRAAQADYLPSNRKRRHHCDPRLGRGRRYLEPDPTPN